MSHLPRHVLPRIASAISALISLAVVLSILNSVESRSGLVWIGLLAGLLATCLAMALVVAPRWVWTRLHTLAKGFLAPQPAGPDAPLLGGTLIAVGVLAYLCQVAVYLPLNDSFAGQDEGAFVKTATEVRDAGGTRALLSDLYTGRFREANRHPLYIWLLSFRPSFESGKLLSVLLGCGVLAGVIGIGLWRRQWVHTGILCLLLGCNATFAHFSVIVGCEVLLVGIVGLYWVWLEVPVASRRNATGTWTNDLRIAGLSAVAMALAWLSKGTGLLLTLGCLFWLVVTPFVGQRGDAPSSKVQHGVRSVLVLAVFGTLWMLTASPLLTRNVLRYQHPFYNVNTWLLFVDEYQDPVRLSQAMSVPEAAANYWDSHDWNAIVLRETQGMIWEVFILLRALGTPPWDDARVLPGAFLAMLAMVGILVERQRRQMLVVLWLAICLPFFAWYIPIAAGERFVIPLLIPLLSCAADGSIHSLRWMRGRFVSPANSGNSADSVARGV